MQFKNNKTIEMQCGHTYALRSIAR